MSLKSILPATTYILSLLLNLNLHSQEEFPASFILEKDTIFQGPRQPTAGPMDSHLAHENLMQAFWLDLPG
ncbi:hypothetical protein P3G55_25660, partial [Leptospira sp. 96542]|nr:hypothetical protein [Leptospira sp. 96542]